jgi:hypothetical protein
MKKTIKMFGIGAVILLLLVTLMSAVSAETNFEPLKENNNDEAVEEDPEQLSCGEPGGFDSFIIWIGRWPWIETKRVVVCAEG